MAARDGSSLARPPEAAPGASRWVILGGGILAVSSASVLIRLAEAPPLAVGAWRLTLATLLLTPLALPRLHREWPRLTRRDLLHLALAGLALAVHFASWITSLSYTSVASSVILVSTNPIFVGLVSHWLLGERIARRTVWAIAIVLLGSALVGYGDMEWTGRALLGDLLALLGAVSASAYLLLGREVRRKLSTWAYVWPCYGVAALVLLALSLASGQPLLGHAPRSYLIFGLLAIGPQILGHSAFNWALGHFSPVFVTLAILGEPVGASLLALLVLGEAPAPLAWLGGALILAGIYVASQREGGRREAD